MNNKADAGKRRRSPLRVRWSGRHRERKLTFPLANSSRHKERTWPLVLRFTKGAIHRAIVFPVLSHACFAALVVCLNKYISSEISLPTNIIPSLSIVVGLMLVFRNQTAFSRVWDSRMHLNTVTTAIRCLSRQILALCPAPAPYTAQAFGTRPSTPISETAPQLNTLPPLTAFKPTLTPEASDLSSQPQHSAQEAIKDSASVEETIKILIAMLYTVKNHLRANWGVSLSPGTYLTASGQLLTYDHLLPHGLRGFENHGLALTLELATFVEVFIAKGANKGWFHNAAASSLLSSLNDLTKAYGSMEVIRLTPIPVAHLIHHRQTLALFCLLLPLSIVSEIGWWSVILVTFVAFTLYGIEGIAQGFEDPFQRGKGDVDLDNVVEDVRAEVECLLEVWRASRRNRDGADAKLDRGVLFRPRREDRIEVDRARRSTEHDRAPQSPGGHLTPGGSNLLDGNNNNNKHHNRTNSADSDTFNNLEHGQDSRTILWQGLAQGFRTPEAFRTPNEERTRNPFDDLPQFTGTATISGSVSGSGIGRGSISATGNTGNSGGNGGRSTNMLVGDEGPVAGDESARGRPETTGTIEPRSGAGIGGAKKTSSGIVRNPSFLSSVEMLN